MSEDVKVKFGGDFTDVSKGASAAASKAGTAMQGQIAKFGEEMATKIGGAFALTALVDKFMEKLGEANEYFKTLNESMRRFGGSGDEFQRVAGLAKSVGVPIEVVSKSMGLFSKYVGLASKDVSGHGKVLRELGFSNEQIASGTITATEALASLSKQLEMTGNENLVAANATLIFGRSGAELMPIIRKGESAIREQSAALKTYSEAELQAAEAAERAIARRQAAWAKFFRWLALQVDEAEVKNVVGETITSTSKELQEKGVKLNTAEGQAQLNQEIIKRLSSQGVGYEAQQVGALAYLRQQVSTPGLPREVREGMTSEINKLVEQMKKTSDQTKEAKEAATAGAAGAGGFTSLVSSSLQALGGGDITSVMSGLGTNEVADNTKRTADGVQKLVETTTASDKPVNNVAK